MTQHVTKMWEIALDETAGMRYSVYVSGRMPLAYYSPAGNDRVLQPLCISPLIKFITIALLEMTGFYNSKGIRIKVATKL